MTDWVDDDLLPSSDLAEIGRLINEVPSQKSNREAVRQEIFNCLTMINNWDYYLLGEGISELCEILTRLSHSDYYYNNKPAKGSLKIRKLAFLGNHYTELLVGFLSHLQRKLRGHSRIKFLTSGKILNIPLELFLANFVERPNVRGMDDHVVKMVWEWVAQLVEDWYNDPVIFSKPKLDIQDPSFTCCNCILIYSACLKKPTELDNWISKFLSANSTIRFAQWAKIVVAIFRTGSDLSDIQIRQISSEFEKLNQWSRSIGDLARYLINFQAAECSLAITDYPQQVCVQNLAWTSPISDVISSVRNILNSKANEILELRDPLVIELLDLCVRISLYSPTPILPDQTLKKRIVDGIANPESTCWNFLVFARTICLTTELYWFDSEIEQIISALDMRSSELPTAESQSIRENNKVLSCSWTDRIIRLITSDAREACDLIKSNCANFQRHGFDKVCRTLNFPFLNSLDLSGSMRLYKVETWLETLQSLQIQPRYYLNQVDHSSVFAQARKIVNAVNRHEIHFPRWISQLQFASGQFATGEIATGEIATGEFANGEIATGEFATGEIATGQFGTGEFGTGQFATRGRIVIQRHPLMPVIAMASDLFRGNHDAVTSFTDDNQRLFLNAVTTKLDLLLPFILLSRIDRKAADFINNLSSNPKRPLDSLPSITLAMSLGDDRWVPPQQNQYVSVWNQFRKTKVVQTDDASSLPRTFILPEPILEFIVANYIEAEKFEFLSAELFQSLQRRPLPNLSSNANLLSPILNPDSSHDKQKVLSLTVHLLRSLRKVCGVPTPETLSWILKLLRRAFPENVEEVSKVLDCVRVLWDFLLMRIKIYFGSQIYGVILSKLREHLPAVLPDQVEFKNSAEFILNLEAFLISLDGIANQARLWQNDFSSGDDSVEYLPFRVGSRFQEVDLKHFSGKSDCQFPGRSDCPILSRLKAYRISEESRVIGFVEFFSQPGVDNELFTKLQFSLSIRPETHLGSRIRNLLNQVKENARFEGIWNMRIFPEVRDFVHWMIDSSGKENPPQSMVGSKMKELWRWSESLDFESEHFPKVGSIAALHGPTLEGILTSLHWQTNFREPDLLGASILVGLNSQKSGSNVLFSEWEKCAASISVGDLETYMYGDGIDWIWDWVHKADTTTDLMISQFPEPSEISSISDVIEQIKKLELPQNSKKPSRATYLELGRSVFDICRFDITQGSSEQGELIALNCELRNLLDGEENCGVLVVSDLLEQAGHLVCNGVTESVVAESRSICVSKDFSGLEILSNVVEFVHELCDSCVASYMSSDFAMCKRDLEERRREMDRIKEKQPLVDNLKWQDLVKRKIEEIDQLTRVDNNHTEHLIESITLATNLGIMWINQASIIEDHRLPQNLKLKNLLHTSRFASDVILYGIQDERVAKILNKFWIESNKSQKQQMVRSLLPWSYKIISGFVPSTCSVFAMAIQKTIFWLVRKRSINEVVQTVYFPSCLIPELLLYGETDNPEKNESLKQIIANVKSVSKSHEKVVDSTLALWNVYRELGSHKCTTREFNIDRKIWGSIESGVSPVMTKQDECTRSFFDGKINFPTIFKINPLIKISEAGKSCPKIITLVDSTGNTTYELLKSNDDVRQDKIVQKTLKFLNLIFKGEGLNSVSLLTYNVVPLANDCGLIEWIAGCKTLKDWIFDHDIHVKARPQDLSYKDCFTIMSSARALGNKELINCFKNKIMPRFQPCISRTYMSHYVWPFQFFLARRNYNVTMLANNIIGYILGVGDRHLKNILVSQLSGQIIHIDYGYMLETSRLLKIPELVPFRWTRGLRQMILLSPKESSVFFQTSELVLKVLRKRATSVTSIIAIFVDDVLAHWKRATTNLTAKKTTTDHLIADVLADTSKNIKARQALLRVRHKLSGRDFSYLSLNYFAATPPTEYETILMPKFPSPNGLTHHAHISILLRLAENENLLAQMFVGWASWV